MKPGHLAFMLLINLIWGFNIVAGKVGVTEMPPVLFTSLRFAVLAVLLTPFLRIYRGQMKLIVVVALATGGLHFSLMYAGLGMVENVSTVAIAIQLSVPFATLISIFMLGETVRWRRWSGIVLSFAGVMVIGFDPQVVAQIDGLTLVVMAALIGSFGITLMKRIRNVGVFGLQAWVATISWPLLLVLSLIAESGQIDAMLEASWKGWGAVLYTSLAASLIGHGGMYYLIQRYEVSLIAPLTLLATVFAVAFGITLMGDQMTWRIVAGGLTTLIGVFIIVARRPVKHAAESTA